MLFRNFVVATLPSLNLFSLETCLTRDGFGQEALFRMCSLNGVILFGPNDDSLAALIACCSSLALGVLAMVKSTRSSKQNQEVYYVGIVCGEHRIKMQQKSKKNEERFSQKNVAELAGLSDYNLSRYESGSIRMPLPAVVAVSEVLGIDPIRVYEEAKDRALRDLPSQIQALARKGLKK